MPLAVIFTTYPGNDEPKGFFYGGKMKTIPHLLEQRRKNDRRHQIDDLDVSMGIRTAIMIDGSFFLKRYRFCYKKPLDDPKTVADDLYSMAHQHVKGKYLYRIFYYDCRPFSKKATNPISGKTIDFSKSPQAIFRNQFFKELTKLRKVALRLGELHDNKKWYIIPSKMDALLKGKISLNDLTEKDLKYDMKQKGVDIKIGADIASLAYNGFVDRIILIAGDSDFIPAAKVARREGIDFILDPMFNHIKEELFEHIDGLQSTCPKP